VYKLVEIERGGAPVPVMKRSPGKQTSPGRKQVWRLFDGDTAAEDVIELADVDRRVHKDPPHMEKDPPHVEPVLVERALLERVMRGGRREQPPAPAAELRARHLAAVAQLPAGVRRLADAARYPVRIGRALQRAIDELG
jgi:nicotinate phosphoribosyltransferase